MRKKLEDLAFMQKFGKYRGGVGGGGGGVKLRNSGKKYSFIAHYTNKPNDRNEL